MWLWMGFILLVLIYVFYKTAIVPYFYWKKRGVAHKTPIPILGNFGPVMRQKQTFFEIQQEIYNQFPGKRYSGFFQLITPTLFVHDIELIKTIGVKHFDHFVDHRNIGTEQDVLFFKNLISLKGNEWRQMRAFLSPAFTASKMRGMCDLMAECACRVTNYYLDLNSLKENSNEKNESHIEVELKDLFTRYTNDVIASCAFGLDCDSLKEQNNEFYMAGKNASDFGGLRGLKMMIANFFPALFALFNTRIFPTAISDFFINIIKDTILYREEKKLVRPDIIHLLLEARKGKLKHEKENKGDENEGFAVVEESALGKEAVRLDAHLSDIDIASQCFVFFIAGFETGSTLLSFVVMELAINPEVQDKLFDEIQGVMTECKGRPTYDAVMKMKYLDMVVSETLRKWPPAPALDRKCTKEFTIEPIDSSEVAVTVKVGELIGIPIVGLHRDPKYFPNPERFDPERFSDENKHNIVPYSYLPFGVGPRACIGSRFALLQTKILMVNFLHKFETIVIDKSTVPIVLTKKNLHIAVEGGSWVGLKRRETY